MGQQQRNSVFCAVGAKIFNKDNYGRVTEARGQFGNTDEKERPPLETVIGGMVKILQAEKTKVCVLVLSQVCELVKRLHLLVIVFCKCSINGITNPNPKYTQSHS
jgi:hypothetical protein